MDEETYKALLERLDAQDAKIADLEKRNDDLRSMNRALLGRTTQPLVDNSASERAKLEELLDKGLKHGTAS